jgi:hypothetical protein
MWTATAVPSICKMAASAASETHHPATIRKNAAAFHRYDRTLTTSASGAPRRSRSAEPAPSQGSRSPNAAIEVPAAITGCVLPGAPSLASASTSRSTASMS